MLILNNGDTLKILKIPLYIWWRLYGVLQFRANCQVIISNQARMKRNRNSRSILFCRIVVKYLVRVGANINAVSDSGSTSVRSSCFMTNMEIGKNEKELFILYKWSKIHESQPFYWWICFSISWIFSWEFSQHQEAQLQWWHMFDK